MKKHLCFVLVLVLFLEGCSISASQGEIGKSQYSSFVMLGEYADRADIKRYAEKYNMVVICSPNRGAIAEATLKTMTSIIGPSSFMKSLMNEFRSMSSTDKEWEIIIPMQSERYFLVTLRNMEDNAVTGASGMIRLPESSDNPEIEKEVLRVFGNAFHVSYDDV
jgi:hypothetical protein